MARAPLPLSLLLFMIAASSCHGYEQSAPRIVEQPSDTVVARHQPATLQCRAEGSPTPTVRWFKDGRELVDSARRVFLPAGGLFFLRTAHARRDSDAGVYWCEATNDYGTVRSRNATLQVAVLREEFRMEPADTRAAAGDTALLECTPPRGAPEPVVFWKKNGQLLDLEENTRLTIVDGGNLIIEDLRQTDDGRYQCIAKNTVGTRESSIAHLRVLVKPYLLAGPEDATALTGSSVTFRCRVGGDPLPDVLWRRSAGGGNMPLGRVHILEDRSLRLDAIVIEDEGEYSCEADNSVGAITASGVLRVHAIPRLDVRPATQSFEAGSSATFDCSAVGSPKPTLFWSVEGDKSLIFPGVKHQRYDASNEGNVSKLTVATTTREDSGSTIVCSAVNEAGSATARARLVVISEEDRPPPVISQGPSDQTLPLKSIAEFPCNSSGTPKPSVEWYFGSAAVRPSDKIDISSEGTLTIRDLSKEDSGVYTCIASSKNGRYEWSANLRVDVPTNPNVNFFRAPELSALPGIPSKPLVKNMSDSGVTIAWSQSNKFGSSALIGFRVELSESGRDTWATVARGVRDTTYTHVGIRPGTRCYFMIRAENSHGLSLPSDISEATVVGAGSDLSLDGDGAASLAEARATLQADQAVRILDVIPVESTAVKIAWETTNSFNVEGFYIYYRPVDAPGTKIGDYSVQSVLHSGSVSGFSIAGLLKYTLYEFFLVPFYKNIDGKPSNSKTVRTLEDVPSEPPAQVEAYLLNSSFIYLKWKPPPSGRNGEIKYYRVVVKEAGNDSRLMHNTTVPVTEEEKGGGVALGGLEPSVSYWLRLAAATSVGEGPYTPVAALRVPLKTDPSSKLLNQLRNAHGQNPRQIDASDLLTETWFLALLGSMVIVMTLLFIVTFFIRRHRLLSKESALPNLYDSGTVGASLVTRLNAKGVPQTMTSTYGHGSVGKTDSSLWMDSRTGGWRHADKSNEYGAADDPGMLPEYDKIGQHPAPDYAEVDAAMICYRKPSPDSPAAYASVTVVPGIKHPHARGWMQMCAGGKPGMAEDAEEVYPASNGGYYNRNVYSDTYFAGDRLNVPSFQNRFFTSEDRAPSLPRTCGVVRRNKDFDEMKAREDFTFDPTDDSDDLDRVRLADRRRLGLRGFSNTVKLPPARPHLDYRTTSRSECGVDS